jgi:LssY C-terminus
MRTKRSSLRWRALGRIAAWSSPFLAYFLTSYVIIPRLWREYEHHHPALDSGPKVTANAYGIPGDPLNVGLVGERDQVVRAMISAGWQPADPITFKSSVKIAGSVLFAHPYPKAPMSSAYLFSRVHDLAFEEEVGLSAKQRHHVRLWQSTELNADGKHFWRGAATFDERVELSSLTGQFTHHVNPDVDACRDELMADLRKAGQLEGQYQVIGVGPTQNGQNSQGDRYYTDGLMHVGVLAVTNTSLRAVARELPW